MKKVPLIVSILTIFSLLPNSILANVKEESTTTQTVISTESKSVDKMSDTTITAKVKEKFIAEKLFGDKEITPMTLHVETTDGVVKLSGTVDNAKQLENAVSIAKKVEGVKKVESDVKVEMGN